MEKYLYYFKTQIHILYREKAESGNILFAFSNSQLEI